MESLNLSTVFFEALNYPQYARPNFFINKQQQSGWGKGVYLMTLSEVYHSCVTRIDIHHGAEKRKNPAIKKEDVKIPIKAVTKGEETGTFDRKKLEELFLAIQYSYRYDREEIKYSAIEILTYVEYALGFITTEFKVQAKESKGTFSRPRTDSYFVYLIAQDAPFFDFPKFKHAFRELLLSTSDKENLKTILKKYHLAVKEIVKLWNDKIFFIEQNAHKEAETKKSEMIRVQFNAGELNHSWWNDADHFDVYSPKLFSNQNFASFAVKIANLLADELLGGRKVTARLTTVDFVQDFIKGIKALQKKDIPALFKNSKGRYEEASFRDWFSDWFQAKDYSTGREILKGRGHIDLQVLHSEAGDKIVEFKGWWNRGKNRIVHQVYKYLTQFEGDGYIFMINNTHKSIEANYKAMVTTDTKFVRSSWKKISHGRTAFNYYKSRHKLGPEEKEVYHFIISVH